MSSISLEEFQGQGEAWNAIVARLPGAHLLQSWEWAQTKADSGWSMNPLVWRSGGAPVAAAMLLKRQLFRHTFASRLAVWYVPRGPLLDPSDRELGERVLADLEALARSHGTIQLKIDPAIEVGRGYPGQGGYSEHAAGEAWSRSLVTRGWRFSSEQVQFRNTAVLDLSRSDDDLLARMKQKARYNIRLAERKGVHIRAGQQHELGTIYRMYAETANRDGFAIRSQGYYQGVWESFLREPASAESPAAELLVAEFEGEPIAAAFVFFFAKRAYYLYGMSRASHREKMPNHLLQWEAVRRSKMRGCQVYDLWGAPDRLVEGDPLWGVYRFKEGLGADVVRTLGAWDLPVGGVWYSLYTRLMPTVLNMMRSGGRKRLRNVVDAA